MRFTSSVCSQDRAHRSERIRPWRSTGQIHRKTSESKEIGDEGGSQPAWPTPPLTGDPDDPGDEQEHQEDESEKPEDPEAAGTPDEEEEPEDHQDDDDVEVQSSHREGSDSRQSNPGTPPSASKLDENPKSRYMSATSRRIAPVQDVIRLDGDSVQIHLQGRPVVFRIPPDLRDTWDPNEEQSLSTTGDLRMEWVYGYRGRNSRGNNIHSIPTGELAYYIASVAILYNQEAQTQRHYRRHTSDIVDLKAHQAWPLCVTAQAKSESDQESAGSNIHIWNYHTLETLTLISDFDVSVRCLALSAAVYDDSIRMAVVDSASKPLLSVWEIQGAGEDQVVQKIASVVSASNLVYSLAFHPEPATQTIVATGKGFVTLWKMETNESGDKILDRKQGLFTRKIPRPQSVYCSAFSNSHEILTGDSDGNVMIWKDTKVVRVLKGAHQGPVGDICVMPDGTFVSGGLADGAFIVFDEFSQLIGAGVALIEEHGSIRRMVIQGYQVSEEDGTKYFRLLVGTTRNSILDVSFAVIPGETEISEFVVESLVQGHTKAISEVAKIPDQDHFLSSGEDGTLIRWDALAHKAEWTLELPGGPITAIRVSFDSRFAMAGTEEGKVYFISLEDPAENLEYQELMEFKEGVSSISLSPTEYLAIVGTREGDLHCVEIVLDSEDKANHLYDLTGHSSHVKHMDWSDDGEYLRTNSADHELLYWNVNNRGQVTDPEELDAITEWGSHTCTLDFKSLAIWSRIDNGTDINSCDATSDLLAVGDDHGFVLLYPFPAIQPKAEFEILHGHSSHVSSVQFLSDGTRLVTGGGGDSSIIQWSFASLN